MTRRGSTVTGQCTSLTIQRDTLPSRTPRTGPYPREPQTSRSVSCESSTSNLSRVADHSVDLDLHVVAQLRDRAPQLLLGLQPVLTLHVLEVLSGLPGHVGLDLGVCR